MKIKVIRRELKKVKLSRDEMLLCWEVRSVAIKDTTPQI